MNANEQLDFYNPDSIYYGNSRHYIQQLEAKVRQQQAEIETYKLELYDEVMLRKEQKAEIDALKEALSMKVILNEHVQDSMKEYKELLK